MRSALLLLHGALGSAQQFDDICRLLSDQFHVYRFSFSGHGGHPVITPFSIDQFVNDTIQFLDANEISRSHIFGYSMGGYVALQLALHHPERVGKILTLGTKFLWTPASAARDVRMMNPDLMEQKVPAFANMLAKRHAPTDWKEVMRLTAEMMTSMGDGSALAINEFNKIDHDVKVCIGTDDHMVSIAESSDVVDQLPCGELTILEGWKHPLESADPGRLAGLCTGFFSEL